MSGLASIGELGLGFVTAGAQVAQRDIDQYDLISVDNPAVSFGWFGTSIGTGASAAALVQVNQLADWPRNFCYSITGITNGTYGGTFSVNGIDQFGVPFTETVAIATAVNGGTVYGTAIAAKFTSGTFTPVNSAGTFIGTASLGLGTAAGSSGNWFGLLTKIGGTGDLKMITWINSTTVTTLNKGTSIGSLLNTTTHAFQGTSGVAATDHYKVIFKPSFDNSSFGTMCAL